MSEQLSATVKKLCRASISEYYNPYDQLNWPQSLPLDCWCTSPELISLYSTEYFDALDENNKRRLSLLEAVNFYSLNIHGEKSLVEGLARRLYKKNSQDTSPYLHHFLDEENKHMLYFGTFCTMYGNKVYPELKVAFPHEYAAGEEDFLFFTKVMIFEEIVDVFNIRMSLDQRLHPIVRDINRMHHKDEARHLVFGRQMVAELFQVHKKMWTTQKLTEIRQYIASYFKATWRQYYNPEVYLDLGLPEPFAVQRAAWNNPSSQAFRKDVSKSCVAFLLSHEILLEEPEL
jgi:hypothetical protein